MQALKILGLTVAAAIVFGVLHDQVTARVCVEYFTIGHPRIFGATTSPTLLALGWGVVATWWAGAIIGVPLALVARVGRWPKLAATDLAKPIGVLLLCMALASALAGTVGWWQPPTTLGSEPCCRTSLRTAESRSSRTRMPIPRPTSWASQQGSSCGSIQLCAEGRQRACSVRVRKAHSAWKAPSNKGMDLTKSALAKRTAAFAGHAER